MIFFSISESPSKNRLLKNLESALSPKYLNLNTGIGGQRSRYGREQKYKENEDFLPTDLIYSYSRQPKSSISLPSIPQSSNKIIRKISLTPPTNIIKVKSVKKINLFYESPIDKLITKNRELATQNTTVNHVQKNAIDKTKRSLFSQKKVDDNDKVDIPIKIIKKTIEEIPKLIKNENDIEMIEVEEKLLSPKKEEIVELPKKPKAKKQKLINIPTKLDSPVKEELIVPKVEESSPVVTTVIEIPETITTEISTPEIITTAIPEIITNNTTTTTINTSTTATEVVKYKIGDLLWGRIGSHPYWPCMICSDDKGIIFIEGSKKILARYHIKFFADNGRRSWIPQNAILEYNGLYDFNNKKLEEQSQPIIVRIFNLLIN